MIFTRVATVLAVCVTFFAGISITAAATTEVLSCESPFRSVVVPHGDDVMWHYTFQVLWCVEDGVIFEDNIELVVTSQEGRCTWVARMDEHRLPIPDTQNWSVYDQSQFWCTDAVNPWGIVGISPDGSSWIIDEGVD